MVAVFLDPKRPWQTGKGFGLSAVERPWGALRAALSDLICKRLPWLLWGELILKSKSGVRQAH